MPQTRDAAGRFFQRVHVIRQQSGWNTILREYVSVCAFEERMAGWFGEALKCGVVCWVMVSNLLSKGKTLYGHKTLVMQ